MSDNSRRQAPKETHDNFRILLDAIEDAVIMYEVLPDGARGPIRDVNQAACNRLGYSREEMLGKTIHDIDTPDPVTKHPSVDERYGKDSGALFETVHTTKDGHRIPVEVNARKMTLDGTPMVLAIVRDITARRETERLREQYLQQLESAVEERTSALTKINDKLASLLRRKERAEQELSESETNVHALLDAPNQSILLIDPDGTIIHVNKAVADNMECSPEESIGRNILETLPDDLAQSRARRMEQVIRSRDSVTFRDVRDGQHYINTIYPIVEDGQVVRMAIYAEDITSLLEKDIELEQSRRLQSVLHEILKFAHSSADLDSLLTSIHKIMIREVGAENFYVALIEEDRDTLEFVYCHDQTIAACPSIPHVSDPAAKRLSLLPIRRNQVVLENKEGLLRMEEQGAVVIRGVIPETWLGAPLQVRGVPIGVLAIQNYDAPKHYSDNALRMIKACSDQIALAIERKRHDEASKTARDIFRNTPSGVFIYQHEQPDRLHLMQANPAAEAITGIRLKDWKGREFEEIWSAYNAPEIKHRYLEPLRTGEVYTADETFHDEDGLLEKAFRVHTFALPGERLGVAFEDITESKRTESLIRESEERYRAFFQENKSVMLIVDAETGRLVDMNAAAERYYGYPRTKLLTMHAHDINTMDKHALKGVIDKIRRGLISQVTVQHRLANGEIRDVEIFSSRVEVNGRIRLLAIVHDITQRMKDEKELSAAKEAAEQANRTKDEFIANISHEVRTPLNGVMGMLQLMQDAAVTKEQENYAAIALQSSRNLLRVLNDVLDFSKIEAGKLELIEEPFDLNGLMDQCANLFQLQVEEKSIDLSCLIDATAQGWYVGDEGRIRQVLFNLLGNAIKFTDRGAITLEVYSLPLPDSQNRRLIFTVRDSGVGIPDDKVDYIFETFTQVDGSLSRAHQGTGLGLPIVKRLVHLMGGNITIESEVGLGTTVTFSVAVEPTTPTVAQALPKSDPSVRHRPLRLLLAEDEKVNRIMATRLLEKMGHVVTTAENGALCLETLLSGTFDAILMDVQMPVLTGLEATRAIRTDPKYAKVKDIPIIALTAHATDKDRQVVLEAGMNGYLAKPYERDSLALILHEILESD